MGVMPSFRDTLFNWLSSLGGMKDKSVHAQYVFAPMPREQLDAAYRSDWVARKVVNIPAADATREWRAWQAENDQIETLEEMEKNFRLQNKVKRALTQARLYGGSALVIGVDQGSADQPLEIDRVQKDALKFIHVVNRHGMEAGPLELDIESPWHMEPKYYTRKRNQTDDMRIHPSRVVRFVGNELPDDDVASSERGWGDSVLQAIDDAVRSSGRIAGGIAALIDELKVDIISVPGFTQMVATEDGQQRLTARLSYANTAKSIVNALVIDKDELWQRTQLNLAGMSELMQQYFVLAAGAADIPATRMLSQSPKGLNATGESDIRNYYDMVASEQDTELAPRLERLDNVIIRSAFGGDEPDIFFNWSPLWQMTDQEKADIAGKEAEVFAKDVASGVFPHMVLRDIRANQLIERGTYPGLEAAMAEADELGLLSNEEPEPELEEPADPNAAPAPANENNPPPKKLSVTVKTGDAAGMIRRYRRRARRKAAS